MGVHSRKHVVAYSAEVIDIPKMAEKDHRFVADCM